MNYDVAETAMRTAADLLGAHLRRLPDGEVGKRFHWIMCLPDVIGQAAGIERVGEQPIPFPVGIDARGLRLAEGTDAAAIVLPPLDYAPAALESYTIFARLREEARARRHPVPGVPGNAPRRHLVVLRRWRPGRDRARVHSRNRAGARRHLRRDPA